MSDIKSLGQFTHVDLLYPSKYLKSADLRGRAVTVTIASITPQEELQMAGGRKDKKPVLYFEGKEKGLVMNKTNARAIAKVYGPELTSWFGKKIVLHSVKVECKGESVDAIRVDSSATREVAGA